MNWQPVAYCISFGSLMASIVAGVFVPFCRKRPAGRRERAAKAPRVVAPPRKDRVSQAIRYWTSERADADLSFIPRGMPRIDEVVEEPAPAAAVVAAAAPAAVVVVEPAPAAAPLERAFELPAAVCEEPQPAAAPQPEVAAAGEAAAEDARSVAEPNPYLTVDFVGAPNFYEILQISPRADVETIHRVYRIMAARFHPDNPVSGDHEMFLKLCEAYEVLSRPERRALYDHALRLRETEPIPIFGTRIFVDGLDGELNRRFGVLALLYQRRRMNQGNLGVSTLELESRMALPREHLEFTLWYLRSKGFVQIQEDNSDYAVTAAGVDYVEANSAGNPILRELLTAGCPAFRPAPAPAPAAGERRGNRTRGEARRARRDRAIFAG